MVTDKHYQVLGPKHAFQFINFCSRSKKLFEEEDTKLFVSVQACVLIKPFLVQFFKSQYIYLAINAGL